MRNDVSFAGTADTETVATEATDMEISFVNVPSVDNNGHAPALLVTTTPKHDVIGLGSELTETHVCVNMKARDLPDDDSQRAPVDIIVALDVSGSMMGAKLQLCKKTLKLLLRALLKKDRFGLICYAENAVIELPVQKMTEANKKRCFEKIEGLKTRGMTNMSAAVGLAREEIRQISSPNEVQTVFFLTDGHANAGISKADDLVLFTKNCFAHDSAFLEGTEGAEDQVARRQRSIRGIWGRSHRDAMQAAVTKPGPDKATASNPITMHCFGFGSDHDSNLLQAMSDVVPGGSYYFVENDVNVGSAFGDALGGVLSVVAQNVAVTISVPEEASAKGVEIINVFHDQKVKRENGSYTIVVGDFYAEESRDILFEVKLANSSGNDEPVAHVEVSVSYTDTIRKMPADTNRSACLISRPLGTDKSESNPHVEVQLTRLLATQAMERARELAERNDFRGATEHLARTRSIVAASRHSAPAMYTESLDCLGKDLDMLAGRVSSASVYGAGGKHEMNCSLKSHSKQRSMKSTADYGAYASKKKMSMKKRMNLS